MSEAKAGTQCMIELASATMVSRDRKLYPQRACASSYASGEILEELQVRYLVLLGNTLLVSKTGFGKIGSSEGISYSI
jgi:hypothetical protein